MTAKLLCVGLHATDDQTLAALPFVTALGAKSGGIDVEIALVGEAVYLMKDEVARSVHGVSFPPLSELLEKTISAEIPIWI